MYLKQTLKKALPLLGVHRGVISASALIQSPQPRRPTHHLRNTSVRRLAGEFHRRSSSTFIPFCLLPSFYFVFCRHFILSCAVISFCLLPSCHFIICRHEKQNSRKSQNIIEFLWVEVIMGINGSYSTSVKVYLGGCVCLFLGFLLQYSVHLDVKRHPKEVMFHLLVATALYRVKRGHFKIKKDSHRAKVSKRM